MSDRRERIRAFIRRRFRGEGAQAELAATLADLWSAYGRQTVERLIPREAAERFARAHLTPERLSALVRPIAGAILRDAVAAGRGDTQPLSRWIPEAAAARLDAMAARPGQVDPEWLRALFRERAVEVLLADTLYGALREFSTTLPKLILSLLPTGRLGFIGAAAGLGTKVVEEIERRLEPEIKSFLQSGTQRALLRAADFAVAHADDPVSVELRKNVLRFALSRSPSFHLRPLTDEALADVERVAGEIAGHVATREESAAIVGEALDRWAAEIGPRTLRDALTHLGATADPPFEAWAEVIQPWIEAALDDPAVVERIAGWIEEAVDAVANEPGPGGGP